MRKEPLSLLRQRRKLLDRAIRALEEFQKLSAPHRVRLDRADLPTVDKVIAFSARRDLPTKTRT